jgi:hypothetical protein
VGEVDVLLFMSVNQECKVFGEGGGNEAIVAMMWACRVARCWWGGWGG